MTNKNKFEGGVEVDCQATQKQVGYLAALMSSAFGGEEGRKAMLRQYFGVQSTHDFSMEEAKLAISLLLDNPEPLKDFYEKNIKKDNHDSSQPF